MSDGDEEADGDGDGEPDLSLDDLTPDEGELVLEEVFSLLVVQNQGLKEVIEQQREIIERQNRLYESIRVSDGGGDTVGQELPESDDHTFY